MLSLQTFRYSVIPDYRKAKIKKRAKKSSGAQHLEGISDILKRIATTEIDITTT